MECFCTQYTQAILTVPCLLQDFEQGSGPHPEDGQQVTFDYTAYNENGNRIDSSYKQGRPAATRLGINGLIPGTHRCKSFQELR